MGSYGKYGPLSQPWPPLQVSPQQDLGGVGTSVLSGSPLRCRQGKGQEDAEALLPKLPPLVGAAQPATLLHFAGQGPRPVQLVPPTALGPGQGRRASCPAKKLITLKADTSNPQTPGASEALDGPGAHPHLCAPGPHMSSAHAPPLPNLLRSANASPFFAHRFQSCVPATGQTVRTSPLAELESEGERSEPSSLSKDRPHPSSLGAVT